MALAFRERADFDGSMRTLVPVTPGLVPEEDSVSQERRCFRREDVSCSCARSVLPGVHNACRPSEKPGTGTITSSTVLRRISVHMATRLHQPGEDFTQISPHCVPALRVTISCNDLVAEVAVWCRSTGLRETNARPFRCTYEQCDDGVTDALTGSQAHALTRRRCP